MKIGAQPKQSSCRGTLRARWKKLGKNPHQGKTRNEQRHSFWSTHVLCVLCVFCVAWPLGLKERSNSFHSVVIISQAIDCIVIAVQNHPASRQQKSRWVVLVRCTNFYLRASSSYSFIFRPSSSSTVLFRTWKLKSISHDQFKRVFPCTMVHGKSYAGSETFNWSFKKRLFHTHGVYTLFYR